MKSKLTQSDETLILEALEYFEYALQDADFSKDNPLYGFVSYLQLQKKLKVVKTKLEND